jgi:outer membrane protein assembly factor BamC
MKLLHQLVCSSLAVLIVSGCSENSLERRQAKDHFGYMDAKGYTSLNFPENVKVKLNHSYDIPRGNYSGNLGDQVDIRPPQEVLALIPGVSIEHRQNEVVFWSESPALTNQIWQIIRQYVVRNHIQTSQNTSTLIETGWVVWSTEDEGSSQKARYRFSRLQDKDRSGVTITLLALQDKDGNNQSSSVYGKDRYTVRMANIVTTTYDAKQREIVSRKIRLSERQVAITMGTDLSGLPVIIARAPYQVMWQRLPEVLTKVGFTITDRNQSQGTMKVNYSRPDDGVWRSLGVQPLSLSQDSYTLLVGDLENRTSINITGSKGKPIDQAKLEELVPVLSALLK